MTINRLSTELIGFICDYLDEKSIRALHLTNRDLCAKTHFHFLRNFRTVEVSLCHISLETLHEMSMRQDIATKIQHVSFVIENMEQYRWLVGYEYIKEYENLLEQEIKWRKSTCHKQLMASLKRMPNLQTLIINDHPLFPVDSFFDSTLNTSLGISRIEQITGIEPSYYTATCPYSHIRRWMYILIFVILRDLSEAGMHLQLEMTTIGQDLMRRNTLGNLLAIVNGLPQKALRNYLKYLGIRGYYGLEDRFASEARSVTPNRVLLQNVETVSLEQVSFDTLLFNLFSDQMPSLKSLVLFKCHLLGLDTFLKTNMNTLEKLTICDAWMPSREWASTFREIASLEAISHLELSLLRISTGNSRLEPSAYWVKIRTHKAIVSGARAMQRRAESWVLGQMQAPEILDLSVFDDEE